MTRNLNEVLLCPKRLSWKTPSFGIVLAFGAIILCTNPLLAADPPQRPIEFNEIEGFAKDKLLALTYPINYMCVHDAFDDLDHDGVVAANDSEEHQEEYCAAGIESLLDPAGNPSSQTKILHALVPFFDADFDGEASPPALQADLQALFGFVPDGFDPTPGVPVHCPHPGPPTSQHTGTYGACAMHPMRLDLGPLLNQLGLVPPDTLVLTPLVNHMHLLKNPNEGAQWWKIIVNLVTDQSVWPDMDGTTGITSVSKLEDAQALGQSSGDISTNMYFYLDAKAQAVGE